MNIALTLYMVQNSDGKFLRSKGYDGYGKCWVDSPVTARIFTKIGTARSQVTRWTNLYPKLSCAEADSADDRQGRGAGRLSTDRQGCQGSS